MKAPQLWGSDLVLSHRLPMLKGVYKIRIYRTLYFVKRKTLLNISPSDDVYTSEYFCTGELLLNLKIKKYISFGHATEKWQSDNYATDCATISKTGSKKYLQSSCHVH